MVNASVVVGAALATIALLAAPSLASQSTFVSPSRSLAFAVTIPSGPQGGGGGDDDLYFSLAFPAGRGWAAVGLGGHRMAGSLMLVAYPSAAGGNVTLSPRLARGHAEPEPYRALAVTTLTNATGVVVGGGADGGTTYVYSGVCHNCRAWAGGGRIDVGSGAQAMVFATGPTAGGVRSDGADAPLRIHSEFGLFNMDLARARGAAEPAVADLTATSVSEGATLVGRPAEGVLDWYVIVHGIVMILSYFVVMPIGVGILRLGHWVRWHGINQGISVLLVMAGVVMGCFTSLYYNRSRNFNSGHQIVGFVLLAFVVAQFLLGYFHHRVFKKTKQTTKMALVHVWLGRVSILLGMFNGFLGFPLALDAVYDVGLAGLVFLVVVSTAVLTCCAARRRGRRRQVKIKAGPSEYVISRPFPVQAPDAAESWQMGRVGMTGSAPLR